MADIRSLLLPGLRFEFHAACSSQNRPASLNDVGNTSRLHIHDLLIQESLIASLDPFDLDAIGKRFSRHRANGGIHSRSVAAAR